MGFEENMTYRGASLFFQEVEDLKEKKLRQEAHQHSKAVWLLADYCIPPDIRETARIWGMEQTIVEIYRNGFIAGWRAAHKDAK